MSAGFYELYFCFTLSPLLWLSVLGVFPVYILAVLEPIPKGEAATDYLSRYINPTLLTGLTELCKTKPTDPFVSTDVIIVPNKLVI